MLAEPPAALIAKVKAVVERQIAECDGDRAYALSLFVGGITAMAATSVDPIALIEVAMQSLALARDIHKMRTPASGVLPS